MVARSIPKNVYLMSTRRPTLLVFIHYKMSRRSARLQAISGPEVSGGGRVRRRGLVAFTNSNVRETLNLTDAAEVDIARPQTTVERITVRFPLSRIQVRQAILEELNPAYTRDSAGTGIAVIYSSINQRAARLREVIKAIFQGTSLIYLNNDLLVEKQFVSGSARLEFSRGLNAVDDDRYTLRGTTTVETGMLPINRLSMKNLLDEIRGNINADYRSYGWQIGEVILNAVTFEFIRSAESLQGAGSVARSISSASKAWIMVSPVTRTNCAFVSMAIAKNFGRKNGGEKLLTDVRAQTKAGAHLKLAILGSKEASWKEALLTEDVFLKCSEYLKRSIHVYNNVFQRIMEVDPPSGATPHILELYLKDSHYCALIRRKEVSNEIQEALEVQSENPSISSAFHMLSTRQTKLTDTSIDGIPIVENDLGELDVSAILSSRKKEGRHPSGLMAAYDLETYVKDNVQCPYALGVAWFDPDGRKNYKAWWGPSCVQSFFDWLQDGLLDGYTLFGHNAGKFDVPLLFSQYLSTAMCKFNIANLTELNGRIISMKLQYEAMSFKFLDSFCFLPQSLDSLTREFKVEHQKLTGTIDHEAINEWNVEQWYARVEPYLTNDCYGLLELMGLYAEGIQEDFDIDITQCCTAASLARTIFFTHYYKPKVAPLHKLKIETDLFIRSSYFGGRCEVFYRGEYNNPSWYYDFTSLYPYVMSKHDLPVGRPISVYDEDQMASYVRDGRLEAFGFFEVEVESIGDPEALPLHGHVHENRLVFPRFEKPTKMVLFSEEIKYGHELGIYKYKFLRGYVFDKEPIMAECSKELFLKKQEATREGLKAKAKAAKVTVNSSYGFWGLRRTNRTQVKLHRPESEKWRKILEADRLQSIGWFPKYIVTRSTEDIETEYMQVAVAAAVTSWARMLLYRLLSGIRRRGHKLLYCDTDSVISTLRLSDYPELIQELGIPESSSELGGLKNELSDDLPDAEDDPCIHSLVVVAPKFYAWKRNDCSLQSTKLKGYSQRNDKLQYDQFELLMNRKIDNLSQIQTQFRTPVSGWVREDRPFAIEVHKVNKQFAIGEYKKGTITESGDVLPLLIAVN